MKKTLGSIVRPSDCLSFTDKYRKKKQEHFGLIGLNSQHEVLFCKLMFIGSDNESLVQPRNLFWELCKKEASAFIVFHNHPSGYVLPSSNDITSTQKLYTDGEIMGIQLLDHLIITENSYYSFAEHQNVLGTHDEEVRVAERS